MKCELRHAKSQETDTRFMITRAREFLSSARK